VIKACGGGELKPVPLFVFFGPPGSGKGTLSALCVDRLSWLHLSTGDLCRKHIEEKTSLGQQIDFIIKAGKLVDDSVIIEMIVQWLSQEAIHASGVILDGVTRTVAQAQGLMNFLMTHKTQFILRVVLLEVSDEVVIRRLSARRVCSNRDCQRIYSLDNLILRPQVDGLCDVCGGVLMQRSDDQEETVKARLVGYKKHAQPLLDFYEQHGIIIERLNGEGAIEAIFEKFIKNVGADSDTGKE